MARRKSPGLSAAAWFYGPTGFGATRGNLALAPRLPALSPEECPLVEPAPAEERYLVSRAEREEQIELEIRAERLADAAAEESEARHPELRCPPRE